MDEKFIIEKEVNKYAVDAVGIFGSRARGDNNEYSDYDIFIIGNLTLEEELELEENLKNKLNSLTLLLLGVIVGSIVYFILCYLFRIEEVIEIKDFILKKINR